MSQTELAADVVARIARDFPGDDTEFALEILAQISDASPRVQRCVVFLAEGDLEKLAHYAEQARLDFRDVIYWAEYEPARADETPRQIRDFLLPFD